MEESKMKLVVGRGDDMADDRSFSKDVKHASVSQPGPEVYGEQSSGKIPFISRSARTSTDSSDDAVARVSASDPSGTSSAPGEEEDESATEASKSGKKRPLDPFSESRDIDSGDEPLEGDEDEESAEKKPNLGLLEGNQAKWDDIFGRLMRYKEEHGDCLVPNRFEPDPSLGAWVSTQRRQYKILTSGSFASTPMTPERAKKLEAIGFAWSTTDPRHVPWEQRYQELVAFKKEHGHCVVPIVFKENIKLANWVSTQRQEAKLMREGRSTRLSEKKIEKLNAIEFVWVAPRGCSGKLKRLREHERKFQQEHARHEREPQVGDADGGTISQDGRIVEATAQVSAAAAAIIDGAPTMGHGSTNNSVTPSQSARCHDDTAPGGRSGSNAATLLPAQKEFLSESTNPLSSFPDNALIAAFPTGFGLGTTSNEETLRRIAQQRILFASVYYPPTSGLTRANLATMAENSFLDAYGGLTPQGHATERSRNQQLFAASLAPSHQYFSANAMAAMEGSRMHYSANTLLAQLQQQSDAPTRAPPGLNFQLTTPTNQSMFAVSNLNANNYAFNEEAGNDSTSTEEKPPTKNAKQL